MTATTMTSVKKPRPAFSCRTCRTRKVRCGREQPECANCRRMNRKCEYQSTSKGFEKQRDSQARSCIGHSAVSKLDAVSRGHYRVRQIDDSLFGLTPFPEAGAVDPLPPHIDFLTIASVLKTIPDKHRCDGFVQAFLTSVYPLHPLINLPRFQSWYVDFWRWCGEAGTGDSNSAIIPRILLQDVTMICVLFAVLYSGAASSALTSQESTIVKGLKAAVSTTLAACNHLNHPTVSTIAASLIVDPFMSRDLDSLEHGLWVSTVVRLAQSVGLNRRKKDTTDQHEDAETQLRRRVWMHLLWLDVQQRLVTGLPLATTVTAGSSLGSLPKPIAGAGQVDTLARNAAILFHALTETAAIQHRFLAIIENVSASTGVISQEVYQGFLSDARTTRNAVDSAAVNVTAGDVEDPWVRGLMALFYLHVAILIHIPFLRPPLPPIPSSGPDLEIDRGQNRLWTCITRLCIRYLRIYISITSSPAFAPYLWFFARCAEPIQCTTLLISYLRHWPGFTGAYSEMCRSCVADVLVQWDVLQRGNDIQMTDGQKRVKVTYGKLERGQLQSQPGDVGTESAHDIRTTGEDADGGFELDMEFLDEVFDWSGRGVHAARPL